MLKYKCRLHFFLPGLGFWEILDAWMTSELINSDFQINNAVFYADFRYSARFTHQK